MNLTGGQIVVETLVNEGVPYLVGIPGHGTLGLSDALVGETRLRPLQVRHEQAAVHLADGYYRVAGTPLAVFTSIGPGAMNTVIGVASCYVDSIPALARAFASGRPAVVEVLVEREYPLSGSPAVGWWDVPVPAYLAERRARYERERAEER